MPKNLSLRYCAIDIPPPLPGKKRRSAGFYEASDAYSNLVVPSPTHSISSAFSASSEEILDEPPPKPSRIPSNVCNRHDSRSSQYDNDSPVEISPPTDFENVDTPSQPLLPCDHYESRMSCDNFSSEFPLPAVFKIVHDSEHQTLRRHTPKTIEVNDTEVLSSENSQVPPPIPPKKHGKFC